MPACVQPLSIIGDTVNCHKTFYHDGSQMNCIIRYWLKYYQDILGKQKDCSPNLYKWEGHSYDVGPNSISEVLFVMVAFIKKYV